MSTALKADIRYKLTWRLAVRQLLAFCMQELWNTRQICLTEVFTFRTVSVRARLIVHDCNTSWLERDRCSFPRSTELCYYRLKRDWGEKTYEGVLNAQLTGFIYILNYKMYAHTIRFLPHFTFKEYSCFCSIYAMQAVPTNW